MPCVRASVNRPIVIRRSLSRNASKLGITSRRFQSMVVDRPHPKKETDKGALISVRRFLTNAGVQYDEI